MINKDDSYDFPAPGKFPFTAGIHEEMYRERKWSIKQYAGYGNAKESNLYFKQLIRSGSSGISIAFDLPTQMGLDPTSSLAMHERGKVGVSISNLNDMRKLLDGIDLTKISTSMTINSTAAILLLMYQIVAEEQGFDPLTLRGTIQNDIIKEFITRSTYIFPPRESLRLTCDIFEYCTKELPAWNPISVSGYHFAEAGATPALELAFAVSNGLTYLNLAKDRGLDVEKIAEKFTFFFCAKTNLIEEIAKFRAARKIWATLLKKNYNFNNARALKMRIHAQTAGSQLTPSGINNNYTRITLQALAAVLGGVQSLHTNAVNEALSIPTDTSSKQAINIQHILIEETDLLSYVDPISGSYIFEELTLKIENEVYAILNEIEDLGGVVSCLESEFQRKLIEKNAFEEACLISTNKKGIVGINRGLVIEDDKLDSANYFKKTNQDEHNDTYPHSNTLNQSDFQILKESARGQSNILYPIKDLILKGASVAQITEILKSCWGQFGLDF